MPDVLKEGESADPKVLDILVRDLEVESHRVEHRIGQSGHKKRNCQEQEQILHLGTFVLHFSTPFLAQNHNLIVVYLFKKLKFLSILNRCLNYSKQLLVTLMMAFRLSSEVVGLFFRFIFLVC